MKPLSGTLTGSADGQLNQDRQRWGYGSACPSDTTWLHPCTRHAVPDGPADINQIAATTGNDPALDTLLLHLHIETACRRGEPLRCDRPILILSSA